MLLLQALLQGGGARRRGALGCTALLSRQPASCLEPNPTHTQMHAVPLARSCFHAVYRVWRLLLRASAQNLHWALNPTEAPTASSFSPAQVEEVCRVSFGLSQLLLAYAWPCLLAFRWEWRDRTLYLMRPEVGCRAPPCRGVLCCSRRQQLPAVRAMRCWPPWACHQTDPHCSPPHPLLLPPACPAAAWQRHCHYLCPHVRRRGRPATGDCDLAGALRLTAAGQHLASGLGACGTGAEHLEGRQARWVAARQRPSGMGAPAGPVTDVGWVGGTNDTEY